MTRFASGAAPWSPQHPPPEPRLPFSLCRPIETQKKRRPPDQREGPTRTMTETTKTHVILLACGSFNPITKGHIQMFGESSRPPPEAASASFLPGHLYFPGRQDCKACAPLEGCAGSSHWWEVSPFIPGSWEGTLTALPRRHLLRADPAHWGPRGGGGEGPEVTVGLDRVGGRDSRTGVRWCGSLATWPLRIGVGLEVGSRRRQEGVGDNVLFV